MGEEEGQVVVADSEAREFKVELRVDASRKNQIIKLSNYAAMEGIIVENPRGNIGAWIDFCLILGEEWLRQRAYQKRGLK